MEITNRPKYNQYGSKTPTFTQERISVNFDLDMFDKLCTYSISTNVKTANLINLRNLMSVLDMSVYSKDSEKLNKIDFIQKSLEARLEKHLTDPLMISSYITGDIENTSIPYNAMNMDIATIEWLGKSISSILKYSFAYNSVDELLDICTRFKAADFISKSAIVQELQDAMSRLQSKFRKAEYKDASEVQFRLDNDYCEPALRDIYNTLTAPNRRLITGMQGINALTGGGFECDRVYLLAGAAGIGKSMTLLNLAYQIKKYNANFQTKDPSKRPCIVYLTQENDVKETVSRLYSIAVENKRFSDMSFDELLYKFKNEGELSLTDNSPIDIIIKYMPGRSIDTGYLYTLTEELEDEGYEVICLMQDHIKKIRSAEHIQDLRLELGEIINEFKVFAQLKGVPVITITHLNRSGSEILEEAKMNNRADALKNVGRSAISESNLMLDNSDYTFFLDTEYDQMGNKWMVFKTTKIRDVQEQSYVCIPFAQDNPVKMLEDLYSTPLYRISLRDEQLINPNVPSSVAPSIYSNIAVLDSDIDNDDKFKVSVKPISSSQVDLTSEINNMNKQQNGLFNFSKMPKISKEDLDDTIVSLVPRKGATKYVSINSSLR